jgi:amino acid adenylation domain-containing protein
MEKNIFFREGHYLTCPRSHIEDFNSVPFPDRSLINSEKYNRYIGQAMVKHGISLQATRGCPYNCIYCHKIWSKKHVFRSAESILKEVQLYYDLGVRRFSFVDDIFNLNDKNSRRFFEFIIKKNMDVQLFFPSGLRGDILTPDYIDLMVEAGTVNVALALETASPRLQKLVRKNLDVRKLRDNLDYFCETYPHIILELFTMHGFPGESEEEAMMTLDFIKKTKWLHFPYVFILRIFPNTDMEEFAVENGVTRESIARSVELAFHELPKTLPFSKNFTLKYRAEFLNKYFMNRERLLNVLPFQMKVLSEDELVQKYNSYLPVDVNNFPDLLRVLKITPDELKEGVCLPEDHFLVPELNERIASCFPTSEPDENALKILLLDLSQNLSQQKDRLSDLCEPPLGLMYLAAYLKRHLGNKVHCKIAKSFLDFDSEAELKILIGEFQPDVIGIRTLTFYKNLFHRMVSHIRSWRPDTPVVAGGPYATSDYKTILQDPNLDLVVLGEGEITFLEVINAVIGNHGKLPDEECLKGIPGIAFIPGKENDPRYFALGDRMTELAITAAHKEKEKKYWSNKLAGELVKTTFPTDRITPANGSDSGSADSVISRFSGELFLQLKKLSSGLDQALHVILHAALVGLLYKYTGNRDIIVGAPIYKQESWGELSNTVLALRTRLQNNITFKDLLLQTRETLLEAIENQSYPLEILLNDLNLSHADDYFPLFDIAISVENIHSKEYLKYIYLNMLILFTRKGSCIEGLFQYNSLLYARSTMERIAAHYRRLLEQVTKDVSIPLSHLELLSDQEKQQILLEFNDTTAVFPEGKTIHGLFQEQVGKNPQAVAVEFREQSITYGDLNKRTNRLARHLKTLGVGPNVLVGIYIERSIDLISGLLGILKAGGAYLPLDINWPGERVRWILASLDIHCILTGYSQLPVIQQFQWQLAKLNHVVCVDIDTPVPPQEIMDPDIVKKLWDHVSLQATDRVTAGGFFSSYTGERFSEAEVDEYVQRIVRLAQPYLEPRKRVLEIGCGAGLIMFEIAPQVAHYVGLDPSEVTQRKNQQHINNNGIANVRLITAFAHDMPALDNQQFDLIIISSTVHFFPGLVYLRRVIESALQLLTPGGAILIGDIPDLRRKDDFRRSLEEFKNQNSNRSGLQVDRLVDNKLYIDEDYFNNLAVDFTQISDVEIYHRTNGFANELHYRYDVILGVTPLNPQRNGAKRKTKKKYIWTEWHVKGYPDTDAAVEVSPDNLAYTIFTSGSTGVPNGVVVTHKPVINLIHWVNNTYQVGPADRLLFITSICFDLSVYDIFGILAGGGTVHVAAQEDLKNPEQLVEALIHKKITFWDSAPAALQQLVPFFPGETAYPIHRSLRLVFLSGDWIPLKLPDHVKSAFRGVEVIGLGGATEATVWSNFYPVKQINPGWASIPYGKPIQNARYYILNSNLSLCPIGVPGDLYIGGEVTAVGYMNNPQLTADRFIPNPFEPDSTGTIYKTGDLARWFPDGNIEFLGRIDHQVKIRGYRIELGELEAQLIRHPLVKECVVTARQKKQDAPTADTGSDKFLCAYIVASGEITTSALKEYLAGMLPAYMIPAHIVKLEKMPVTPNGKLDRKALPEPEASSEAQYVPPKTEIEKVVADTWKQILKLDKIGIHDNFFDLGGNSLTVIQLNELLKETLEVDVPVVVMFERLTISSFIRYLEQEDGTGNFAYGENQLSADIKEAAKRRVRLKSKRKEITDTYV